MICDESLNSLSHLLLLNNKQFYNNSVSKADPLHNLILPTTMHNQLRIILKLTRINMSTAIAFSALAGYIMHNRSLDLTALWVFIGVLLLAASATVLNQYQERHLDALMARTKDRPLPSKQLTPKEAIIITIIFGITGTLMLYFLANGTTALLGLFNIAWYNGLYTPLKRKTSFAVLVGALTGAIPPMMGWTGAGGYLFDPYILFIAMFMFFWQIPHFCLLLLKFKKDYELAGFPSITSVVSEKHVVLIVFIWIIGTVVSTLFFPLLEVITGTFLTVCLLLLNVILIISFYKNAFGKDIAFNIRSAFGSLYLYQVLILVMLIIQALT